MRETYQNILNVIIIIFILAAAILFYNQQKAISQLKNQNNSAQVGKNAETKAAVVDPIDQAKNSLEANLKFIKGRLISISENNLTVEADMPDFKKAKEINASKKSPAENPGSPPTYKKTYTITINDETKFLANKLEGIKAGDTIEVKSKELVYQTDKLTAVSITSPSALPAS